MTSLPRVMLAAPSSKSGKTMITCGLLKAMLNRRMACRAFKCGPDYIDTMFHRYVSGIPGANLDTYFLNEEQALKHFCQKAAGADISVIEGVMGYYDGLGGASLCASTYEAARITKTPVILIIDAKGASLSLAAVVKGFLEYTRDSWIKGVILNRISPVMGERLKPAIEALGVRVYGCLPECKEGELGSRHLGLVLPEESEELNRQLDALAEKIEETIDLDGIIELAREAEEWKTEGPEPGPAAKKVPVKIGVALDQAFCFYYEENIDSLRACGAEPVFFSPVKDLHLPEEIGGLYLGGGYPELYAKELSKNESMRKEIRSVLKEGMPAVAECGGFLYLHESLEGMDGRSFPMAGLIEARAYRTGRLSRFGYLELSSRQNINYIKTGESIKGHEFHYWESTDCGTGCNAKKPIGNKNWDCIHTEGNLFAGFPHLYYPSCPQFAERFVTTCVQFQKKSQEKQHEYR